MIDAETIGNFDQHTLENLCLMILEHQDLYNIEFKSNGQGQTADLVGRDKGSGEIIEIMQCKASPQADKVTTGMLRNFIGAMQIFNVKQGSYLATGTYTDDAIKLAQQFNIKILKVNDIVQAFLTLPQVSQDHIRMNFCSIFAVPTTELPTPTKESGQEQQEYKSLIDVENKTETTQNSLGATEAWLNKEQSHKKSRYRSNSDRTLRNDSPFVQMYACLFSGWLLLLLPIPLTTIIAWPLIIATFILTIICFARNDLKNGLIGLAMNLLGTPVVALVGVAFVAKVLTSLVYY